MTNSEFNSKSNNSSSNLDVNKQIFIERPIGKINVGKLITLLSFINIGVLFVLFIFSALVCLHAFHKTIGFYGEKGIDQGGIALIVFDSIFLLTALVLQLYIWRYKIGLKRRFWKKIFWTLILATFLFMLFGISDVNTVPWIYNNSKRTGGWWLVLGIFIGILIYELIILLSNVLPHKIKHKFARTLSPKHRNDEQNSTANG